MQNATARQSTRDREVQIRDGVEALRHLKAWWMGTVAAPGPGKNIVNRSGSKAQSAAAAFLHILSGVDNLGTDLTSVDKRDQLFAIVLKNLSYRIDHLPYVSSASKDGVVVLIGTDDRSVRDAAREAGLTFNGIDRYWTEKMKTFYTTAQAQKADWWKALAAHEAAGNDCPNVTPPWETPWGLDFLKDGFIKQGFGQSRPLLPLEKKRAAAEKPRMLYNETLRQPRRQPATRNSGPRFRRP